MRGRARTTRPENCRGTPRTIARCGAQELAVRKSSRCARARGAQEVAVRKRSRCARGRGAQEVAVRKMVWCGRLQASLVRAPAEAGAAAEAGNGAFCPTGPSRQDWCMIDAWALAEIYLVSERCQDDYIPVWRPCGTWRSVVRACLGTQYRPSQVINSECGH